MKKITLLLLGLMVIMHSQKSTAQETGILDSIGLNMHMQLHIAYYNSNLELQDNAPRIGSYIDKWLTDNLKVFGRIEFGVNMSKGAQFNNNANNSVDFVNDPFDESVAITNRLGYVGVSHKTMGTITMGKQWSVYYDIGGFTDVLTVFGANAVDVYAGKTDGGWKGTGRADQAVVYRNTFGGLQIGLQTQLYNDHTNFGASLLYTLNDSFKIGAGFNIAEIPDTYRAFVADLDDHSGSYIFGIQYNSDVLYMAANAAWIEDEFKTTDTSNLVSFPTYGIEFVTGYHLNEKIFLEGGFNFENERSKNPVFNGNYRLLQFYYGINYYLGKQFSVYCTGRIDSSREAEGSSAVNAVLVGVRYVLNTGWKL